MLREMSCGYYLPGPGHEAKVNVTETQFGRLGAKMGGMFLLYYLIYVYVYVLVLSYLIFQTAASLNRPNTSTKKLNEMYLRKRF